MKNYIQFAIRYRFIIVILIILITILAGAILSTTKFSGSLPDLLLGESPKFSRYLERVKQFGSDVLIIIAFEEDDLLSEESITRLKNVVSDLKANPKIQSVKSIMDLMDVKLVGGMPQAERSPLYNKKRRSGRLCRKGQRFQAA